MEGARQLAIDRIKQYRQKFKAAGSSEEKQKAAEGFKTALIALTVALKSEQNQSKKWNKTVIKNELKKKLPELESQLVMMFEASKVRGQATKPQPQNNQPVQPKTTPNVKPSQPNGTNSEKPKNQIQTNLEGAIIREKPNVQWEDVAGLEGAKKALKEAVILPIKFPEIFVGQRRPWKGILLYGPPGTGKTFLAKACATQMEKGTFFSVSSSDLMSKYVGESEKTIKTLFSIASNEKPSIIFIDQIDSLTGNRSEGENEASRRVKTEFLVQMDGVGSQQTGILVLGATNLPWDLDPAIRRRFQRRVYIPLPDVRSRLALISNLIKNNPNEITQDDLEFLAERTEGFSGSDISVLVRDAMFEPIRLCQAARKFIKIYDSTGQPKWSPCSQHDNTPGAQYNVSTMLQLPANSLVPPTLNVNHFKQALTKTKPSVNQADLHKYIEWTKSFGQDG